MNDIAKEILAASVSLRKLSILSGIDIITLRQVITGQLKDPKKRIPLEKQIRDTLNSLKTK